MPTFTSHPALLQGHGLKDKHAQALGALNSGSQALGIFLSHFQVHKQCPVRTVTRTLTRVYTNRFPDVKMCSHVHTLPLIGRLIRAPGMC